MEKHLRPGMWEIPDSSLSRDPKENEVLYQKKKKGLKLMAMSTVVSVALIKIITDEKKRE